MNWAHLLDFIQQQWQSVTWIELIAVFFSVLEVLLSYRNNVLLYPSGIISCALFIWLLAKAGLYAESLLNSYYLIMSLYGWYMWSKRLKNNKHLLISICSPRDWSIASGLCLASFGLLFLVLHHHTSSDVPAWDAFVSATAWAGMWLLARRKVENWVLLNISNAAAVPLLFHKHLPLTALLTIFLFIVAVLGFFRWRRIYKEDQLRNSSIRGSIIAPQ